MMKCTGAGDIVDKLDAKEAMLTIRQETSGEAAVKVIAFWIAVNEIDPTSSRRMMINRDLKMRRVPSVRGVDI